MQINITIHTHCNTSKQTVASIIIVIQMKTCGVYTCMYACHRISGLRIYNCFNPHLCDQYNTIHEGCWMCKFIQDHHSCIDKCTCISLSEIEVAVACFHLNLGGIQQAAAVRRHARPNPKTWLMGGCLSVKP